VRKGGERGRGGRIGAGRFGGKEEFGGKLTEGWGLLEGNEIGRGFGFNTRGTQQTGGKTNLGFKKSNGKTGLQEKFPKKNGGFNNGGGFFGQGSLKNGF